MRKSAGTALPASNNITSPGTNTVEGKSVMFPSRSTRACVTDICFKASIAFSARYSCIKPRKAFNKTIMRITIVSVKSPTMPDIIAATSIIKIITSLNCASTITNMLFFLPSCNSLVPVLCNLSSASFTVKPSCFVISSFKVSSILFLCQFML